MSFMKALIITWENFQDQEVVYPFYRLKEETEDVKIVSNVTGRFHKTHINLLIIFFSI